MSLTSAEEVQIFRYLQSLPADHDFWKNEYMFTRDVFTNESRQGNDSLSFWEWVDTQSNPVRKLIGSCLKLAQEAAK